MLRLRCEFFAAFVIEYNGYALESIYVSKGISEEERDIICQSLYVDWEDWSVVYWFGDCRGGFDKKDFLINARFLGFIIETEWDRDNYEQISDESGKEVRITFVKKPPSDVMDQVVARLPLPGPKLVPGDACLIFVCAKAESESFTGIVIRYNRRSRSIYVSKGISKEERDIMFGELTDWSQETTAYWHTSDCGGFDFDRFFVSARFMGFGFEDIRDVGQYNTRDDGRPKEITLVKNPRQIDF